MCTRIQLITSCLGLAMLAIFIGQIEATEYPTPPPVPSQFLTPNDVQKYLNQLHNYYMVVGRPRFGKRSRAHVADFNQPADDESYVSRVFNLLDLDGKSTLAIYLIITNFSAFKETTRFRWLSLNEYLTRTRSRNRTLNKLNMNKIRHSFIFSVFLSIKFI